MPQLCLPLDTSSNRASCIFAYKAWVTSIADLLYNNNSSVDSVTDRLTRFTNDFICTTEPSLVLKCCKVSYDLLIDFISKKVEVTYSGFKDQISAELPIAVNLDAFLAPVNRLLSAALLSECSYVNGIWRSDKSKEIKSLLAFFGFLTKLPLSNTKLEEDALLDYTDFEENYPILDVSNPYLRQLKNIITIWFKDFRYDGSKSRHGKGAVADAKAYQLDKFRHITTDVRLDYLFNENYIDSLATFAPLGINGLLDRCSTVVFVPKNVSKLRTISMEPTSLQYVQQGVMTELYDFFKAHKYLRNHIQLEDQTVNQSLAYDGSITNNYATIDLSHASDSVSYQLVKYLFSGIRPLYRWIVGSRSDYTRLPNGERIKLNKFAPMGSALCFPIETAIFAAIAQLAVSETRKDRGLCKDAWGQNLSHFTAYGDDIIVPVAAYPYARRILQSLNFSVNEQKSYGDSPFKESCGGNYYCGLDVTPLKWRTLLDEKGLIGPKGYVSLCTCINNANEKHLKITRAFILQVLRNSNLKPLFTPDSDKSPAIYSTHCTNFHLKKVWHGSNKPFKPNYQKFQFVYKSVSTTSVPAHPKDKEDIEKILYFQSLIKTRGCQGMWILGNNMCYSPKNHTLTCDASQQLSGLSVMEKVLKFSRGLADV